MTKAQEKAKTILIILDRVDDPEIKNDLVSLFTIPYLEHTKENLAGLKGDEVTGKILEFLRAVADGKIVIDDKEDFGSGIPPLEELVRDFEEARRQGSTGGIEESQVRKALIKAVVAQKKEEQIVRLLKEAGISQTDEAKKDILGISGGDGQTADIPEAIKQVAQRYRIPVDKAEVLVGALVSLSQREGSFLEAPSHTRIPVMGKTGGTPAVPEQETAGEERKALLIRISYKRPSILNFVVQELSRIPGELPGAAFETRGEILPVLVNHGIGLEKLRSAVENFRLQNPGLAENHPVILSLKETLKALADYSRQHPQVDGVIKNYQNEIGVDISLVDEVIKDLPSTNSRVFLRAVVRPDKGGVPKLFIVPLLAKKEVGARAVSVSKVTKQVLVPKNVLSRFLVSFKKLLTLPTSLLAGLKGYLGGTFIISALFLPLPLPIRVILAGGGFWLGWKQIKGFFANFVPQILSAIKRVDLLKLFSKTLGNILYTIFTKPSLAWLRSALAAGFGAGALLLPVSIPLKILFLGIGGMFGTVQLSASGNSFLTSGMGAVGRAGVRLSYALATLPGIPLALILGAILLAVLLPGFLAYQSAQTQALFLPQAGGATSPEYRFIGISASATPANIKNEELPKTVEFAIVISAKEQALSINFVTEIFAAFVKDKTITIPEKTLTVPKTRLAPGESTEVRFSLVFDKNFEDSAVTATTLISAFVDGQASPQTASASTTVIIGSPPTSCFAFSGYWNEMEKNKVTAAIAFVSKSQAFITKLCAGAKTVKLIRGGGADWSGEVDGTNGITLFDRAFNAPYQPAHLYYTLAHESGHVYGNYNSFVFSAFLQEVKEPFLATYSRKKNYDEDFAETIGMFIASRQLPSPFTGVNLPILWETYPQHHRFAKTHIFSDGVEY